MRAMLEIGSSVTLKPGGHVTPLAADTLRARRITVLSGVAEASLDGLAPVADIKSIAIGSDHSGVALKATLRDHLRQRASACSMSAPRAPIRWTIPTSPRRSRGWWRARKWMRPS